VASFTHSGIV